MSTADNSGQEPEQHIPPTIEAGCEIEIDRSVPGTVAATGFAELRARVFQARSEAKLTAAEHAQAGYTAREAWQAGRYWAFDEVMEWLNALEAHAKDAST